MTRCALAACGDFRELLPFAAAGAVVTIGEGQTLLQLPRSVGKYVGMNSGPLYLQYEGMNPSGSFKDNGMSAAFTHARHDRRQAGGLCFDRQHQCVAGVCTAP